MKKPIFTLLCLLWVFIPHAASAGGSNWEYQVVKFNRTSPTSAEFSLRPTTVVDDYARSNGALVGGVKCQK